MFIEVSKIEAGMKKILFSAILIILLLFGSETVSACVCVLMPNPTSEQIEKMFENDFKKAGFVFSGEVIHLDEYKVTFKIQKMWKGSALDEITMSTGTRDRGSGSVSSSSCDYNFEAGKKYLVYTSGSGKEMQAYECSGTGELTRSEERIKFLKKVVRGAKAKKSSLH